MSSSIKHWLASLSGFSHIAWRCPLSCTLSCSVTGSEPCAAPVVRLASLSRSRARADSSQNLWPAGCNRKLISRLFWIKPKMGKVLRFSGENSVQSHCSDADEWCCRSCTCISNDAVTREWKERSSKTENALISTFSRWVRYQVNQCRDPSQLLPSSLLSLFDLSSVSRWLFSSVHWRCNH